MANVPNYNFSYSNPFGTGKPQGPAVAPMSIGKPYGTGKPSGGFNPTYDNPMGMKQGDNFSGGIMEGYVPDRINYGTGGGATSSGVPDRTGYNGGDVVQGSYDGFQGQPAPESYGTPSSFPMPQFNNGGGYGQQLNRFMGHGGNFNQFRPRMGAQGPQYRNGGHAQPYQSPVPPKPTYGGDDGSIGLPPPPDAKSYVKPNFGGGY